MTRICKTCHKEKDISEFSKSKAYKDGYNTSCKECEKIRMKNYRRKNKDKIKEQVRLKYLEDPLKHILQVHKSLSKTKNIPCDDFDILYNHLKPIFDTGKCERCGMIFQPGNDSLRNYSPTLDRLIPNKGYVVGNIAVLCHDCNRRKQDMSVEEMKDLIRWVENKIENNNLKYGA